MTLPAEKIINRDPSLEVKAILNMYSSYIEEAVNYGTNLLFWKGENFKDESPVTDLLLHNYLDHLDSLSILVKSGAREASKIILRSLFEINLYIHFISDKHTALRAYSFIVVDILNRLKDLDKLDSRHQSAKQLKANILREPWLPEFGQNHDDEMIKNQKDELNQYLNSPHFNDVLKEYQRVEKGNKVKGRISWYNLFEGGATLQALAKSLNKLTIYEILYREWSKPTHGINIFQDKIIEENGVTFFRPLREPTGLMIISKYACNFSINTFGYYIQSRHPNRLAEYKEWENKFTEDYGIDLDHEYINFKHS